MATPQDTPPPEAPFRVELTVDGEPISLKPFIHEMIGGGVAGLVRGLRGVESPRVIELRVERDDGSDD